MGPGKELSNLVTEVGFLFSLEEDGKDGAFVSCE